MGEGWALLTALCIPAQALLPAELLECLWTEGETNSPDEGHFPTCFPAGQEACLGSQFIINATPFPLSCVGPSTHPEPAVSVKCLGLRGPAKPD